VHARELLELHVESLGQRVRERQVYAAEVALPEPRQEWEGSHGFADPALGQTTLLRQEHLAHAFWVHQDAP
jgi:hypothetical protein